jgi:hypothetical protein
MTTLFSGSATSHFLAVPRDINTKKRGVQPQIHLIYPVFRPFFPDGNQSAFHNRLRQSISTCTLLAKKRTGTRSFFDFYALPVLEISICTDGFRLF